MSSDIHVFLLVYLAMVLGTDWWRATNRLSYLVGVVVGWRGSRVLCPRYFACYLRVALQRHPRIK